MSQPALVLLRQWDHLVEEEGMLFHRVFCSDGEEDYHQLVLSTSLRQEVLTQLHQQRSHQAIE